MARAKYKQGVFKPLNPEKYTGTTPILYRSKLELLFMRWCDSNRRVLEWGSESIIIPYQSPLDGRVHRYFVDNNIKLDTPKGIRNLIIEIKPSKYTKKPTVTKRKKKSTILYEQTQYMVNSAKWNAANAWADKQGYSFAIITEKDLIN